jgi:hypothetical protein
MKFAMAAGATLLTLAIGGSAQAITLDGLYDAAYGSATATVPYDASAPSGDFNGGPSTNNVAYSIYMTEQGGNVYTLMRAASSPNGQVWANVYYDLDPVNGNGSDLGFEVLNNRAFVPGIPGYSGALGIQYALSGDGLGLEFVLPDSLFTTPIAGLTYYPSQQFPGPGDEIVLRLSQSFGYSVAGGSTFGPDRLGAVNLASAATPLPAALPMFATGLAGLGWLARRKRKRAA